MCKIIQIKKILMNPSVFFSSFALALCDRYDSQIMQGVFQKLEAKILELK